MARGRRAPAIDRVSPPGPTIADLHAHTARSDGLLEPAALVAAAAEAGLRLLAITDHDTLAGYREVTDPSAAPLPADLAVLPGVEINAVARGLRDLPDGELHLVGLGVDPADSTLEAALADQRARRRARFAAMIGRLRDAGFGVDAQLDGLDMDRDDSLGRPILARALVAAGHASSVQDAFARLVGHGGPGYVPRDGLNPAEAIRAIRAAGGIAILAHFSSAPTRIDLIRDLMAEGLNGIEAHHRSFDATTVAALGVVARDLGLIPSGGTDYHGDGESYAEALAETWIPPDVTERIRGVVGARAVVVPHGAARPAGAAGPSATRAP